jgi:hypothetical protein
MSELRYPNESREYRDARDGLLKDEQALVAAVKASFLGDRSELESPRYGVAVLESHGLHARRPTRLRRGAAEFQI